MARPSGNEGTRRNHITRKKSSKGTPLLELLDALRRPRSPASVKPGRDETWEGLEPANKERATIRFSLPGLEPLQGQEALISQP